MTTNRSPQEHLIMKVQPSNQGSYKLDVFRITPQGTTYVEALAPGRLSDEDREIIDNYIKDGRRNECEEGLGIEEVFSFHRRSVNYRLQW